MSIKNLLLFLFTLGIGWLFFRYLQKRKEKSERERNETLELISSSLAFIDKALKDFFAHDQDYQKGYFTNSELYRWKASVFQVFELVRNVDLEYIGLDSKDVALVKLFQKYYEDGNAVRDQYNAEFVKHELNVYSDFFDNVEGIKLDTQQRTCIVKDEDNNLVIAGAGSGKTTTIVGKVAYVMDRYKVPPDQILLISFTNKSAAALAARININGIEAKTFHKFGKDVITEVERKQPSIFDEKQFTQLVTRFFNELMLDPAYLDNVTSYFTNFLKPLKSQDEFKNQGEYIQYLKDQNFSTYKTVTLNYAGRVTLKREVVKSAEECSIANFLLFNNIAYEYEYPYEYETADKQYRQYKPDFTISAGGKKVYLEHYALNKNGSVPHFFADEEKGQSIGEATKEYTDGITWKRELHKKYGTKLIETYSHEAFDNTLFSNLTQHLKDVGIPVKPKAPTEIWKIISAAAEDEVDNFITLLQTFISLMKSNNYSIEDIKLRNEKEPRKFFRQRGARFIEIFIPVYEKYQEYLRSRKEIDFSDMINNAAGYISAGHVNKTYKYIIIDEFQDISIGRYKIVKALNAANPGCKLFCVGDDWQSIYRFAGSDISLFKNFESYFGYTEKAKIETTFRFNDPLISVSSNFILNNPHQTRKELRGGGKHSTSTHKIVYSVSESQDDTNALQGIFNELLAADKSLEKEVVILGRYSFDIKRIRNEASVFQIDKNKGVLTYSRTAPDGTAVKISARFMTVHKSKGLEADIVIVINCNSGKYGFPSSMSDDPVLALVLSEADQFENGEERRLFYVALTRAKEAVYLVSDSAYKSKFITELEMGSRIKASKRCPRCKTADLVKKTGVGNGKPWAFYGCSNYLYGCNYKKWITK